MKLLIIFIVSFVVLCAYANENSTESGLSSTSEQDVTTSEATSTESGLSSTTSDVPICGRNEEYKECSCRLKDLCLNRFLNKPCLRCRPGCMCREGYLRRRLGSPCLPKEECGFLRN